MLIICLAAFESDGESELFTELYQRYHRDVYRMAYSILRNRALAEDTAQDTWVWTARHFSRLQEVTPRKRKAYLITAARNKALNVKAREKRHISWEAAAETGKIEEQISFLQDRPQEYRLLVDSILSLPENYSRILEMKFVLGMSSREIARELHMKAATVDTRIARGRKLLIEKIEEETEYEKRKGTKETGSGKPADR